MVQTSMQYTPVQVLQAARRAEAEGKMDYALQFYRHLVEQHGTTPEAQEAREGLFRIAEWRWGEARIAQTPGRQPRAPSAVAAGVPRRAPPQPPKVDEPAAAFAPSAGSDTRSSRRSSRARQARSCCPCSSRAIGAAKIIAYGVSGLGCSSALAGIVAAVLAGAGGVEPSFGHRIVGLPLGIVARRAGGAARARAAARRPARGRGVREHQRQPRNARDRARPRSASSSADRPL